MKLAESTKRYIRHRANKYELDAYDACCRLITLGEQKIIFGTVGLKNILKKYDKIEAVNMVKEYLTSKESI